MLSYCNEMGILNIDLNDINTDSTNYDEDDPETNIHMRLLARHNLLYFNEDSGDAVFSCNERGIVYRF